MFEFDDSDARNILLVEGSAVASSKVRQVLTEAGVSGRLHNVSGIAEAIAYLRREPPYFAAPIPSFVLLGQVDTGSADADLVHEIQRNPTLRDIRVLAIVDERPAAQSAAVAPINGDAVRRVELAKLGEVIEPGSTRRGRRGR